MININFDNPYLLLLLIPLVLLVVIPFAIAIRKENRTKGTVIALISHLLIVVIATLAVAGMKNTSIMTKTEVYVLADVSNSTSKKTDLIDSYIKDLEKQIPRNGKMGVITFAADYKVHTPLGGKFTTVKDSGVNDSATDILAALRYVSGEFSENAIKRIVLYTDGMSSDPNVNSGLIREIENLSERNVYVDVVYIDSSLSPEDIEIQVSEVELNSSTYLGHKTSANVLIESTAATGVIVRLQKDGAPYLEKTANLTPGYNIVNFDLGTEAAGEFDYSVSVHSPTDGSLYNNSLDFTQIINENISVLLVTDNAADEDIVKAIYGEDADVDAYVKPTKMIGSGAAARPAPFNVPFTVEDLCKYDEFVISNVKVEDINNANNFVSSLDICVSVFGKSLITAGENNLQNSDAECVKNLNSMLPVNFGNTDSDPKLYTIIIDSSRSMEFKNFDYFKMAKSAAKYLLGFLREEDHFALVHFSGSVYVPITPTEATKENIDDAIEIIDALEVTQGTMIGKTLDRVYEMLASYTLYSDKQAMLISDGMSFEGGEVYEDDPVGSAAKLLEIGVVLSTLNTGNDEGVSTMKDIAAAGGGKYYFARSSEELPGVMFEEVADDVNETFIEKTTEVNIKRPNDSVMSGVTSVPSIEAYLVAKPKSGAENVLTVNYVKSSGKTSEVPLYSYWNYGNGKVSTLTTALGGDWVPLWQTDDAKLFLKNVSTTATPEEKVDYPYTVDVTFDGKFVRVEIIPAIINPDATMTVEIVSPSGTSESELLVFDSYRYFYRFETSETGKYKINTTYTWSTKTYSSTNAFNISYSPEYNRFASYSPALLHSIVRDNGKVYDGENAKLEVDETRIEKYVIRFTVPFLILAVAAYVIDTIIRKLTWADIVSFFKKKRRQ